jgi:hypothetical protein
MTNASDTRSAAAWAGIEQEKRFDRFIRRVCAAAWSATAIGVLAYAVLIGVNVVGAIRAARVGVTTPADVLLTVTPLVVAIGLFSALVAILTTIGLFLRQRTASLTEIQLRLAALEDMLAGQGDRG